MDPLSISVQDIRAFDIAIAVALTIRSNEPLGGVNRQMVDSLRGAEPRIPQYMYNDDGSLVVSFDGRGFPFLCNTMGRNPIALRWYIPINPMLRLVGSAVESIGAPIPGGRTFLHVNGCFYKPDGHRRCTLLHWVIEGEAKFLNAL